MAGEQKPNKAMNIILWIVQALLAFTFIWAGYMKLFQPADKLAAMWPWTTDNPGLTKLAGIVDLLAGLGLILPGLLRIMPKLTVYAACGTIVLMIVASIFHISRGEGSQIGFNVFVMLLAIFVAWGRQKKVPIAPE